MLDVFNSFLTAQKLCFQNIDLFNWLWALIAIVFAVSGIFSLIKGKL